MIRAAKRMTGTERALVRCLAPSVPYDDALASSGPIVAAMISSRTERFTSFTDLNLTQYPVIVAFPRRDPYVSARYFLSSRPII